MSTTTVPYTFEKKGFLFKWVLADTLGALVGLLTVYGVAFLLAKGSNPDILTAERAGYALVVSGIVLVNILIGLGEHLVLKRHLKLNTSWFLTSVFGVVLGPLFWMIIMKINPTVGPLGGPDLDLTVLCGLAILIFLLLLLITVFLQWRILRKIVHHAGHWFWMKTLSFIGYPVFWLPATFIFFYIVIVLGSEIEGNSYKTLLTSIFILIVVTQILSGAAQGAISGAFMQRLLKEPAAVPPV